MWKLGGTECGDGCIKLREAAPASHGAAKGGMRDMFVNKTQRTPTWGLSCVGKASCSWGSKGWESLSLPLLPPPSPWSSPELMHVLFAGGALTGEVWAAQPRRWDPAPAISTKRLFLHFGTPLVHRVWPACTSLPVLTALNKGSTDSFRQSSKLSLTFRILLCLFKP